MGNKHDLLERKALVSYRADLFLENHLNKISGGFKNNSDIKILDLGCGRGRGVLHFLEKGYDAYGVDIDLQTIHKGFALFKKMGYDPNKRLLMPSGLDEFEDGFFHIIYSEQVFEHVENLEDIAKIQQRLLKKNGVGYHVFPAAKNIRECHVNMPLVHWLPKNRLRKLWISLMMMFSKKPEVEWPETKDTTFWEEVNVYYKYLNNKTYYRSVRELSNIFEKHDLSIDYKIPGMESPKKKILPDYLIHNGFPDQQVYLTLCKK